jgi:uncharacterized protein YceK
MVFLVMMIIFSLLTGCGAIKYKTMYGITDWYYTNHITLQAQYSASTPEQQVWMKTNVNPYMNILQQGIIAMGAIDRADDVKVAGCASEITRIATGVKYDASRIVVAIKAKDYDTLLAETLALKTFIIQKLAERK